MEPILFLVGIGLILIGLIGKIEYKDFKVGTENRFVRAILGVMGVVFVYLALSKGYFPPPPATPTPKNLTPTSISVTTTSIPCSFHSKPAVRKALPLSKLTGSITSPEHCDMGIMSGRQSPIMAEGITEQIPNDTYLWLFVYAPAGRYYPQCNDLPATKSGCTINGEWSMRTYLADECKPFYLVLVSTDTAATDFLLSTMSSWERTGSYPGFRDDELKPYEIRELYSVQVETGPCATQTPTP